MIIKQITKYLEEWAPKEVAWEKDNVGLQIGDMKNKISNILLALDLDTKVVEQAKRKKCNLIITHHPFIFTPLKKLNFNNNKKARLIKDLILNNISLYSAHTNLDYTKNGVSFELAKRLGLKNIRFLEHQASNQYKLVVFVPEKNIDTVSNAIFNAGGGIIGEYSKCSTKNPVEGTFEGSEKTNPFIGNPNTFETVSEIRLEVLVDSWKLDDVVAAMKYAHPYEEPAFDILVLKNKNLNYGTGAIGELPQKTSEKEFLSIVKTSLKANGIRYSSGKNKGIKRVAVCGGTCSDYTNSAIINNADAFITADVKYHTFQDAEGKIMLVDAGHYETEVHVLLPLKKELENFIKKNNGDIKVFKYSGNGNPVKFFN